MSWSDVEEVEEQSEPESTHHTDSTCISTSWVFLFFSPVIFNKNKQTKIALGLGQIQMQT